jgi:CheY-like chemotaxis protein
MGKNGRNQTVMIVDDTEDIRDCMSLQLCMLGYRVLEAASGQEAIELVQREVPKLILMDLAMPGLDGIEVTRLIRENLKNSSVVIIAFTAQSGDELRQRALAAGCNDYVRKPLAASELSSLLDRHLSPAIPANTVERIPIH